MNTATNLLPKWFNRCVTGMESVICVSRLQVVLLCVLLCGNSLRADDGPADSPREALIKILTTLSTGTDDDLRKCCSEKGWEDFQEALRELALEDPTKEPTINRKKHFSLLLPLRDKEMAWKFYGTKLCTAADRHGDSLCEGFLLIWEDRRWKLHYYSSEGAVGVLEEMYKEQK